MKPTPDDEIIEEVRRARARTFRECGGTLEGLYARVKELEQKETRRVVVLPPRRPKSETPERR